MATVLGVEKEMDTTERTKQHQQQGRGLTVPADPTCTFCKQPRGKDVLSVYLSSQLHQLHREIKIIESVNLQTVCMFAKKTEILNVFFLS